MGKTVFTLKQESSKMSVLLYGNRFKTAKRMVKYEDLMFMDSAGRTSALPNVFVGVFEIIDATVGDGTGVKDYYPKEIIFIRAEKEHPIEIVSYTERRERSLCYSVKSVTSVKNGLCFRIDSGNGQKLTIKQIRPDRGYPVDNIRLDLSKTMSEIALNVSIEIINLGDSVSHKETNFQVLVRKRQERITPVRKIKVSGGGDKQEFTKERTYALQENYCGFVAIAYLTKKSQFLGDIGQKFVVDISDSCAAISLENDVTKEYTIRRIEYIDPNNFKLVLWNGKHVYGEWLRVNVTDQYNKTTIVSVDDWFMVTEEDRQIAIDEYLSHDIRSHGDVIGNKLDDMVKKEEKRKSIHACSPSMHVLRVGSLLLE